MDAQLEYNALNNWCGAVTKSGDGCTRKAPAGHTMCKQHREQAARDNAKAVAELAKIAARQEQEAKWKAEQDAWRQERLAKRGTEKQRAKFRAAVLEAWYAKGQPEEELLKDDSNGHLGYNSDLEVEDDGVGVCSACGATEYCIKVNHGQVYCAEREDCWHSEYTWFYDCPRNYPEEIPEEFRK